MKVSDLIRLLISSCDESGDDLEICFGIKDQEWHPIDAIVRVRHKETGERLLIITNDNSGTTGKAPNITLISTGTEG